MQYNVYTWGQKASSDTYMYRKIVPAVRQGCLAPGCQIAVEPPNSGHIGGKPNVHVVPIIHA